MTEQARGIDEQVGTEDALGAGEDVTENDSYHGYSVDDEDQPQSTGDSLSDSDRVDEPLDEGYSPPEKWSAAQRFGNTPLEEQMGESLDQRLEQEEPEPDPYDEAANQSEHVEGEVGDERTGRLVAEDDGATGWKEQDLMAEDIGVDGAGASAEEAAVHTIAED